eukprot:scaffold120110_cov57-Phaeocystis_antarctica.AAC.1
MRHGPARELRIAAPIGAQLRCSRFSASTAAASHPFPRGDDEGGALRCCALVRRAGGCTLGSIGLALPPGLGAGAFSRLLRARISCFPAIFVEKRGFASAWPGAAEYSVSNSMQFSGPRPVESSHL